MINELGSLLVATPAALEVLILLVSMTAIAIYLLYSRSWLILGLGTRGMGP